MHSIRNVRTEILRIQTDWEAIVPADEQWVLLDLYCIPEPPDATPPIEAEGDIRIDVQGKPAYRAAVAALMDSYWRFANEILLDPLGQLQQIRKIMADIADHYGPDIFQVLARRLRKHHPGEKLYIHANSHARVSITRTEGSPAALQLHLLRRQEIR